MSKADRVFASIFLSVPAVAWFMSTVSMDCKIGMFLTACMVFCAGGLIGHGSRS